MRFTGLTAASVVLSFTPRVAPAQAPPQSGMLSGWYDSLTTASGDQLAGYTTLSRTVPGDVGAIRRALYQVRDAEVRDDRHELDVALMAFDLIAAAHRRWAWPVYAMADGYAYLAREHAPLLALNDQSEGESHADAVWRNLADALRNDPDLAPARRLATALMVAGGDRQLTSDEDAILAGLLTRPEPEADVLLVLARDLRRRRNYDSALAVFNLSLAAGGDRSRLALERARTLGALGHPVEALAAYWDGLRHLTVAGREMYRFDLAWILTPDSLSAFDRVSDHALPGWFHRFWDERDAAAANHPGERLLEHFRRWAFVLAHYRVDRPWRYTQMTRVEYLFEGYHGPGFGWDRCVASDAGLYDLLSREAPVHAGDIREHEPLLDHRGLIYLKHGQPWRTLSQPVALMAIHDARAISGTNPVTAAENDAGSPLGNPVSESDSWLYWFEGGWRLLHFRGSDALGQFRPSTLSGYLPVDLAMYAARADMLPEYAAAADAMRRRAGPLSCMEEVRAAIAKSRDDAHTAATTDSDTPVITTPWISSIQVFALGHAAERSGKMLLAFAFSGGPLVAYRATTGGLEYPIHFRIVAYNRANGQSVTLDTVRRYATSDRLRAGQSLTGWLELPLPGGTWQVAVRANEGVDSAGTYMLHRNLLVDAVPGLSLSDIVTGRDGTGVWPATDGAAFPLNVLDAWVSGGTARLFYEVRGLHAGDGYQTLVELAPVGNDSRKVVRFRTTDRAAGSVDYVRKSLGLEQLKPGKYHLSVTVSHGSQQAVRGRDLVIGEP